MLIPSTAWQALSNHGVGLVPIDAQYVELRRERWIVRLRVHAPPRALNPSDVAMLAKRHPEPALLVVPAATPAARQAAERAGWSWLVADGERTHGVVHVGGRSIHVGAEPSRELSGAVRARPGPVPWGWLTIVRRLLELPSATQQELAIWAEVSQPRVSQALTDLARREVVERTTSGWVARDFDRLLRLWLDRYPGPGGISTYWYGLESPHDQAEAAVRVLSRRRRSRAEALAVVSGDVAADLIAPWRSPLRAVVYARSGADLSAAGLAPAGHEEATLELVVPRDLGVWPMRPRADVLPLADEIQILWDLRRSPGPDSVEAADMLWTVLRTRSRAVPQDPPG
jgi:hypothetical protein